VQAELWLETQARRPLNAATLLDLKRLLRRPPAGGRCCAPTSGGARTAHALACGGVQAGRHCAANSRPTPGYLYSTYGEECEGRGPATGKRSWCWAAARTGSARASNSTYCCVHAALAMREDGYETIMVNCNPETVSTDYDTSDRLYFESLTMEDVLEIAALEQPLACRAVRRPDPAQLALALAAAGVR